MPSTYTVNLGIEKPATGEQSGTWGDTTNVNFDIIDQAVNGSERVTLTSAGTSGSPNDLNIVNGSTTSSEGRNKWIEIYSASDLGGSAYVRLVPNDAEKILFIRNSLAGSQSVLLFQGTYNASNDLEIPAGVDMVVKFDGAGASATVTDVFTKLRATEITTPTLTAGTADINGGSVDGATIGAASASTGAFTTLTASTNLNIASSTTVDGVLDEDDMSSDSATKLATQQSIKAYVDSQVGTVDTLAEILANGNTSGANNLIIDNGQALTTNTINETTAGTGVTIDSVLLKDDVVNATDVETSNISANDGTAAATIANSTGNFTITNFISNSVDIGGGAIDGTNIGASSAGTGAFTSLTSSNSLVITSSVPRVTLNDSDGTNTQGDIRQLSDAIIIKSRDGSSNGVIKFSGENGTTETEYAQFDANGTFLTKFGATFNEDSADVDFRVESNTNTHALFVNAGDSRVGINESSPNAMLHVKTSGTDEMLRLEMVDDSNTAGPDIVMQRVSASPAANDPVGRIRAIGENSDGSGVTYGRMEFFIDDPTAGSESGLFSISTELAGANIQRLAFKPDEVVFNEPSQDSDFRVESDSDTHALFVDAGLSRVGIKEDNPQSLLHITETNSTAFDATSVDGQDQWGATLAIQNLSDDNDSFSQILFRNRNTSKAVSRIASITDSTGTDMAFVVETSGSPYEVLRIAREGDMKLQGSATPSFNFLPTGAVGNADISYDGTTFALVSNSSSADMVLSTSSTERVRLNPNSDGIVFNENSNDYDFRVESTSTTHMLFVDAGNNQVGVGTSGVNSGFMFGVQGSATIGDRDNNIAGGGFALELSGASLNDTIADYGSYGALRFFATASYTGSAKRALITNGYRTNQLGFLIGDVDTTSEPSVADRGNPANALVPLSFEFNGVTVVNQEGDGNLDFRVESDSNTHMLFVDGGTNKVVIGDSSAPLSGGTTPPFSLAVVDGITLGADPYTFGYIGDGGNTGSVLIESNAYPASLGAAPTVTIKASTAGGSRRTHATFNSAAAIFNEDSADIDFRVESNDNSHQLAVDALRNNVQINNSNTVINSDNGSVIVGKGAVYYNQVLTMPSPYTGNVQIDLDFLNWGSNNVIAAVDVMILTRQFNTTSGIAMGKMFATNTGSGGQFTTFTTTDITTSNCTFTASSPNNYRLRLVVNPSNVTDQVSIVLTIPTLSTSGLSEITAQIV